MLTFSLLQASSEREKQLAAQAAKAHDQVAKAKKRGKQVKSREAAKAAAATKRLQQRQARAKQSRDDAAAARLSTAGLARAFMDTGIPAKHGAVSLAFTCDLLTLHMQPCQAHGGEP